LSNSPPRLLYAVTAPESTAFLRGRLAYLTEHGYDVHVVSSPGDGLDATGRSEGVTTHALRMQREPAPLADIVSLVRAWRLLRRLEPDIVDASTPKAGLLFSLASFLSGVPCRVYSMWGLRLETATGFLRLLLTLTERVACACAHRVECLGPSLRQLAIESKLANPKKLVVIGAGGTGIATQAFALTPAVARQVERLRRELHIETGTPVVGYVGRLVRDKGINELVAAFMRLKQRFPRLTLLLVGQYEDADPVDTRTRRLIETTPGIVASGWVEFDEVVPFYHLMDTLALPTYREGHGGVTLEASAAGKPVVTTNATGAKDTVIDGVTGFAVPVGDAEALANALGRLLENPELARQMGEAGRKWVKAEFQAERIWKGTADLYREMLSASRRRAGYSLKRPMDVCLSALGLLVLSPLLAVVSLFVRFVMGRPVFIRQERPGLHGRPFRLLKFRSMRQCAGTDAERLTRLGRFLRRFSIDELPELWNVLKGEMSFVGPRPLLMEYLDRYTSEQARRHEVKPGITGWAQVNGRNAISWEQKFALDVWYVDHQSLWLDVRILALTIWKVLRREGISQQGQATMEEFRGSPGATSQPTKDRR
jgi:lipopolysaccharide/colanic/teichoic acid biosynthesis glycosyltransferase